MFKPWNHPQDINKIKRHILDNRMNKLGSVSRKYSDDELDELKSIAKAQLKARNSFDNGYKLMATQNDLRYSTPQIVGDYRAKRVKKSLGNAKIVDLFSGVGLQTISFAKNLKRVLSVEIDERKVAFAERNFKLFDLRNVDLIKGDVFSEEVINKVKEFSPSVIFADPERKSVGSREDEEELIVKIYETFSPITKNLIIEIPPYMSVESLRGKIHSSFESEYLSIDGNLRRLTLYFGKLRRFEVSCVKLPEEYYLGTNHIQGNLEEVEEPGEFIIELDEAFSKSGLFSSFLTSCKILSGGRNFVLTSNELVKEDNPAKPFIQEYKTLLVENCSQDYDNNILAFLKEHNFKYVVLKQGFSPETYWQVRKSYENKLKNGDNKMAYLFKLKNKLILSELVTS